MPNVSAMEACFKLTIWTAMLQGGYSYSGQRCTAVKVVLVEESVADELVAKVKKGVEGLSVGMPEVSVVALCSILMKGELLQ